MSYIPLIYLLDKVSAKIFCWFLSVFESVIELKCLKTYSRYKPFIRGKFFPFTYLLMFKFKYQFSSVSQSCPTLCDPMDCSMPGLPVCHQLPEFTQTHGHWAVYTIKPSCPLSSLSPPAFNLSQHQGLFQWVSSSHQVAKVLECQLQHQSFQWIFRTDFLGMDWLDLLAVQGTLRSLL